MRRTFGLIVIGVALIVGASAWVAAQSGTSQLEGAWAVQEITSAKPPAFPPNKPIGLVAFTGRHYSLVVLVNSARPNFGEGGAAKATADQIRAVWGAAFAANAGTFTVSGNTIRYTAMVAKNPNVMAQGNFSEDTFTLKGDTLILTDVRTNNGPTENPQTTRLTRVK
jgi:hypothetical protein